MKKKYVYADLPRTGLCNMLFPWARAVLYARDHGCKMLAPNWVQLNRLGPWLRQERDKRYYFNQFTNKGYVGGISKWAILHFRRDSVESFSGIGEGFDVIVGESEFLKRELHKIANDSILKALRALPPRFIAAHVRRGDFKSAGLSLEPAYYVKALKYARSQLKQAPILVFSDASSEELSYLLDIGGVTLMPKSPALQDMLSLAQADILVGTNNSSFSLWGAFLGKGCSIWSDVTPPMREKCRFEGMVQL